VTHLGFGVWGTPESGGHRVWGSGWQGQTCVKNLPRAGVEVCAKFGEDWSGGSRVKKHPTKFGDLEASWTPETCFDSLINQLVSGIGGMEIDRITIHQI